MIFNDNPQLNILISSQETDAQLISLSGPLTVQLDLTGVISKFEPQNQFVFSSL